MKKLSKKAVIELLKTGDFTIAYHDSGYCTIYKNRLSYENLPEDGEVYECDCDMDGYIPAEVSLLVKALGGRVESA